MLKKKNYMYTMYISPIFSLHEGKISGDLVKEKLCGRSTTLFMVATMYAEDQSNDQIADLGYSVKEEQSDEPHSYMRPELFSQ